jgi:hypothetical protein
MTHERRRHPRVPASFDGRWQSPAASSLCRLANLSQGGCFARTPSPPEVNDPMLVTLFFNGYGAMPVGGRVARVEPGVGFAMEFGDLGTATRQRLGEEIAQIRRRM